MIEVRFAGELIGRDPRDIRAFRAEQSAIDGHLFAKAAVETALWDIAAKREREAIVARLRAIPLGDMRAVGMQADEYHEAERELFIAVAEGRDHG